MGGQHVSAALRSLYEQKKARGIPDDDIEAVLQTVQAEVILQGCPTQLARLGAGHHQRIQHDTRDSTTEEIFAFMCRTIAAKVANHQPAHLTDNDVWLIVESMGLSKESGLPDAQRKSKRPMQELMV